MNVYDFDGTVYNGDSSVDFFLFCCKKHMRCISVIPRVVFSMALYAMKRRTKEQLKSEFFGIVKKIDDIDSVTLEFWNKNRGKIKKFYREQHKSSDIIISASPDFLLRPICEQLGVRLIATDVDPASGRLIGKNCYGEEKVNRLSAVTDEPIEEFYTDSLSDRCLCEKAERAYIVDGDRIASWRE